MTLWPPAQLTPWLTALASGQPAAAPAEGLYGYVANPFHPTALQNLLAAKQRPAHMGLIVLIQNLHQLPLFCPTLPDAAITAIQTYWQPGQPPTTLILPALSTLPELLTGTHATIAVRLPHTAYMQEYIKAARHPLVSTSLNLTGQPAATQASEIPPHIPALKLPTQLTGQPSRIFNPLANTWLR